MGKPASLLDLKATGVWMGLRRCGCPVAVCTDYGETAPKGANSHVAKCKREFLADGLNVVYATWDEWVTVHGPKLARVCEHETATQPNPSQMELLKSDVGER